MEELAPETATDPVCGMKVKVAGAAHRAEHAGHTWYFCSDRCRTKFTAEPDRYLRPAEAVARPAAPAGAIYTCPMHPEIRQPGPGSCPICGMALEPAGVSAESGPSAELVDMTRRFWVGAALAAPLVILDMAMDVFGIALAPAFARWVELALATPVVLWAGWPFFERAWASVRNRSLNMFSLIALGTGTAYAYSLVATFAPGWFPEGLRRDGMVAVYYEAAAVITVLVLLGQVLELR